MKNHWIKEQERKTNQLFNREAISYLWNRSMIDADELQLLLSAFNCGLVVCVNVDQEDDAE